MWTLGWDVGTQSRKYNKGLVVSDILMQKCYKIYLWAWGPKRSTFLIFHYTPTCYKVKMLLLNWSATMINHTISVTVSIFLLNEILQLPFAATRNVFECRTFTCSWGFVECSVSTFAQGKDQSTSSTTACLRQYISSTLSLFSTNLPEHDSGH